MSSVLLLISHAVYNDQLHWLQRKTDNMTWAESLEPNISHIIDTLAAHMQHISLQTEIKIDKC